MDFKPAFPRNETVSCIRSAPTLDDLLAIVNDGLKTPLETFSVKDLSVKRPTHILALISLASWWPSSRNEGNDLNGRVWGCNGSDVDAEIQSPGNLPRRGSKPQRRWATSQSGRFPRRRIVRLFLRGLDGESAPHLVGMHM
jgi:hypothetical protein